MGDGGGPSGLLLMEGEQERTRRTGERWEPWTRWVAVRLPSPASSPTNISPHIFQSAWAQEAGFLNTSVNEENDEEECESVNDRSVNINKVPHVTKTGPGRFLEKNLKKIMCKVPDINKVPHVTKTGSVFVT